MINRRAKSPKKPGVIRRGSDCKTDGSAEPAQEGDGLQPWLAAKEVGSYSPRQCWLNIRAKLLFRQEVTVRSLLGWRGSFTSATPSEVGLHSIGVDILKLMRLQRLRETF